MRRIPLDFGLGVDTGQQPFVRTITVSNAGETLGKPSGEVRALCDSSLERSGNARWRNPTATPT